MKRIVLCADDYGQAQNISSGILKLAKLRRLSAVSCLVNGHNWKVFASELKELSNDIDIGLHFNLTEGHALSNTYRKTFGPLFRKLPQVLLRSHLRQYSEQALRAEFAAQLDTFIQYMGFEPTHIDGHQHVHQFPQIRDAILHVYQQRFHHRQTYLRLVKEKLNWQDYFRTFKKVIIHKSGSEVFEKLLLQQQIPHNKTFAGIYNFAGDSKRYRLAFQTFLGEVDESGLIMCHPGLAQEPWETTRDAIAAARRYEYAYFASDDFIDDCERQGVKLTRFCMLG